MPLLISANPFGEWKFYFLSGILLLWDLVITEGVNGSHRLPTVFQIRFAASTKPHRIALSQPNAPAMGNHTFIRTVISAPACHPQPPRSSHRIYAPGPHKYLVSQRVLAKIAETVPLDIASGDPTNTTILQKMKIDQTEIHPFEVINVCIRQQKARDGESEGGWRLDLVVKNTGLKPRSKVEVSLRYYNRDQNFTGLDQQRLWKDDIIKPDETKDLTFYIEPPKEAEKAELRILSRVSLPVWVHDPPVWLIFLAVFVVVGIVVIFQELIK